MTHRTLLGLKLATASICFLILTIVSALSLRAVLGYGDFHGLSDSDRSPASVPAGSLFEHRGQLNASELGLLGASGLNRGRKVHIDFRPLQIGSQDHARTVAMNLFPDTVLTVDLQTSSVYGVNSGLLVGQVHDDPSSSVRLMIQNGVMDGTLQTRQKVFRIIDGGAGLHIITEAQAPADK